jgi:hypothetical protein
MLIYLGIGKNLSVFDYASKRESKETTSQG